MVLSVVHPLDEGIDVEQGGEPCVGFVGVIAGGISNLTDCGQHLFPGAEVALAGLDMVAAVLLNLYDVDVGLLAAEVVFAKLFVHALGKVVESPVHAVDEEVDIKGVDAGAAYLALHAACPHVAGILCFCAVALCPVLP